MTDPEHREHYKQMFSSMKVIRKLAASVDENWNEKTPRQTLEYIVELCDMTLDPEKEEDNA